MAQARKKRRTKHRGNAAGTVEARGRTTRPASPQERKRQERSQARATRVAKPPTWSGSAKRAGLAAAFMFVFLMLTTHPKHGSPVFSAALFAVFALLIYLPAGYYLEGWLYRRRMARQDGRGPTKQNGGVKR
jgi:hypothetical protein